MDEAVKFAAAQGAHLTGLHVIDIPEIPGYVATNFPREVLENHRKLFFDEAEKLQSAFTRACENSGLSFNWACVEGDIEKTVIRAARSADLILVVGGAGIESEDRTSVADRVVLEGGRPVLVIPAVGSGTVIGSKVGVAWSASKEATRAVHDALPLLQAAERVWVVSVNPPASGREHGEAPRMDIAAHLSRHGIRAEAQAVSVDDRDTGQGLLDWASNEGADLMVMGAYGHTRWRELVLGGVTAHVLRRTRVPVLMSH